MLEVLVYFAILLDILFYNNDFNRFLIIDDFNREKHSFLFMKYNKHADERQIAWTRNVLIYAKKYILSLCSKDIYIYIYVNIHKNTYIHTYIV